MVKLERLLLVYPHKENVPEFTSIEFYVDFELDEQELVDAKELEREDFDYIHEQIKNVRTKSKTTIWKAQ
jgi:hypothetical protein